jgi:hypothetical protein
VEPYVPHRQSQQISSLKHSISLIYPALYNGPINFFARLVREKEILLEQFDHYQKQTYRNRCKIMGPNGVFTLTIPVKKVHGSKTLLRDIRIDYDTSWNRNHWRSLVASYASSPYFEFMADELAPFYHKKYEFLIDLNRELLVCTLEQMGLDIPVSCSSSFTEIAQESDPRYFIHPKKRESAEDPDFLSIEYHQVFSDRLGFIPNLSVLDLLFNEGPSAPGILRQSLRTYSPG